MIHFAIYGQSAQYTMTNIRLSMSAQAAPARTTLETALEQCAAIIANSFLEDIDPSDPEPKPPRVCPVCGEPITEDNYHHESLGCDECTEEGYTNCTCCAVNHDLDYVFERLGLALTFV